MSTLKEMGVKLPPKLQKITVADLHTISKAIMAAKRTHQHTHFCSCCCSSS